MSTRVIQVSTWKYDRKVQYLYDSNNTAYAQENLVDSNLPQAEFELGSLGLYASMLQIEPSLLVYWVKVTQLTKHKFGKI